VKYHVILLLSSYIPSNIAALMWCTMYYSHRLTLWVDPLCYLVESPEKYNSVVMLLWGLLLKFWMWLWSTGVSTRVFVVRLALVCPVELRKQRDERVFKIIARQQYKVLNLIRLRGSSESIKLNHEDHFKNSDIFAYVTRSLILKVVRIICLYYKEE